MPFVFITVTLFWHILTGLNENLQVMNEANRFVQVLLSLHFPWALCPDVSNIHWQRAVCRLRAVLSALLNKVQLNEEQNSNEVTFRMKNKNVAVVGRCGERGRLQVKKGGRGEKRPWVAGVRPRKNPRMYCNDCRTQTHQDSLKDSNRSLWECCPATCYLRNVKNLLR